MLNLKDLLTTAGQGEYVGEDGLIHCDHCKQPRQTHIKIGDKIHTVRCQCDCQQAQYNNQRERLHNLEEMDRVRRIRSAAMVEPALRKCTFDASDYDTPGIQLGRQYVAQWPDMYKRGMGLILWGSTGTGKTYIAACIANAILDQGIPVLMTSLGRMLGAMPGPTSGEQTATIDQWMQYPLLIIDDLGAERDTPYTTELVYQIIDARCRTGRPMIITTNLTMKQMDNPPSLERERIYRRILERCSPVHVDGVDIRQAKRRENRDFVRNFFI